MGKRSRSKHKQTKADKPRHAPGQREVVPQQPSGWMPSRGAVREVIESVAVALILAFLFRTFEAEAFVIPTGSMAPTLLGRHRDVVCDKCGYRFEISASEEVDDRTGTLRSRDERVEGAVCPMCGYAMQWVKQPSSHPAMKGDRILVGKFVYQLGDPQRWDVVVFKFPGEASTNFIKRLVGLPGETIRVHHGDVFVKAAREEEFHIARKPPRKLRAMLQPVFDHDLSPAIEAAGFPPRWRPTEEAPGWQRSKDGKSFFTDGSSADEAWLRYEHRLPNPALWQMVEAGQTPPETEVPPRLISDAASYNTSRRRWDILNSARMPLLGVHWVGDLALECTLDVKQAAGRVVLELVEGGRRFQCRIDLAKARAELAISGRGMTDFRPAAPLPIDEPGCYRLLFANCDNQLVLWVDDEVIAFDAPTAYGELENRVPNRLDLSPAGIAAAGAPVEVSHLKLYRDIYYIATNHSPNNGQSDYLTSEYPDLAHPASWYVFRNYMRRVEFPLGSDEFLVFGDNSPKSKDSRIWASEGPDTPHYVSRELLIGKALVIFWPDTKYKLPLPGSRFSLPYFPNFREMGFVR